MLLVPGRPSSQALLWWLLSDTDDIPALTLQGPGANLNPPVCRRLGEAGDPPLARRAHLVAATGLQADTVYTLEAVAGNSRAQATSRTLPQTIAPLQPFSIAFGSCFNLPKDRGINAFYPPVQHGEQSLDPIRLRVLCGDQIYMDLSATSASPLVFKAPDPWQRYGEAWRHPTSASFLSKSPTLMLADDHEFWNDYPHRDAWLLWSESSPGGTLGRQMERAFDVFQAALNLAPEVVTGTNPAELQTLLRSATRAFDMHVAPLRLLFLDTRTARSRYDDAQPHVTDPAWLTQACQWIRDAPGPCVLFVSQPVIEKRIGRFARLTHTFGDANLPDYTDDFATLWDALVAAPADRLVVSGDIHWSRLYLARKMGNARVDIYEAISSPLSLLPGDPPGTGGGDGKVEWERPGGRADWTRRYATAAEATYTTLTFTMQSGGSQPDVEVHATVWGIPPNRGQGAIPLCQDRFTLRGVV